MMDGYEKLLCKECKHYESYHKYPNPNAVARHYCKRCKDEIRYMKYSPIYNYRIVWLPKLCYFNDYFERKENEV